MLLCSLEIILVIKLREDNMKKIFVTDIGSTTTKTLLLEETENAYEVIAEANSPTTVEQPEEDVVIGISNAIREINNKDLTNFFSNQLQAENIQYFTSSSAGGGLQMLILGLTARETGNLAEMTAHGAGGVVIKTINATDKSSDLEKIRDMRLAKPDIILMAGGIDGGGLWGVLRLAELLKIAAPQPKYLLSGKIPFIFAGNKQAQKYITNILGDFFDLVFTPNIRPDMLKQNTRPARNEIHKIFMQKVMECAPGYQTIKEKVTDNILPTPAAVENTLKSFSETNNENTVLVDIGGATTDIFSFLKGKYHRTVCANTGMSYSLNNLIKDCGLKEIKKHLSSNFTDDLLKDYAINKSLNPTILPLNDIDRFIEATFALTGIKYAYRQHLKTTFNYRKIGLLDRIHYRKKKATEINPFDAIFESYDQEVTFQESAIKNIIGAGGLFTAQNNLTALLLLAESFKIKGITNYYRDKNFKTPHIGMLPDRKKALQLYKKNYLDKLGTIISPFVRSKKGKTILTIKHLERNEEFVVKSGETLLLKKAGTYKLSSVVIKNFPEKDETITIASEFLLVDCRIQNQEDSLFRIYKDDLNFTFDFAKYHPSSFIGRNQISTGTFSIRRELPYKGQLEVKVKTKVNQNTVLGKTQFQPPKIFIINLNREIGSENSLSKDEIMNGVKINIGDSVKKGDTIFTHKSGLLRTNSIVKCRVNGIVSNIENSGLIILKEIQDYEIEPVTFNLAKIMGIDARTALSALKYKKGDFIEKGQILCEIYTFNLLNMFKKNEYVNKNDFTNQEENFQSLLGKKNNVFFSPATGYLTNIDKEANVTIEYKFQPYILKSHFDGEVENIIKDQRVDLRITGKRIQALIGFGQESSGELCYKNNLDNLNDLKENQILLLNSQLTYKDYQKLPSSIKGIIIPSIHKSELEKIIKKETGVILTGYEELEIPILITEGFGNRGFSDELEKIFKTLTNQKGTILPHTQIRAGVKRPELVIS